MIFFFSFSLNNYCVFLTSELDMQGLSGCFVNSCDGFFFFFCFQCYVLIAMILQQKPGAYKKDETRNQRTGSTESGRAFSFVLSHTGNNGILVPRVPILQKVQSTLQETRSWIRALQSQSSGICSVANSISCGGDTQTPSTGLRHPSFNHCRI